MFESEKSFLLELIGEFSFGSIEHVGSTAVRGMVAKPIIDIMFGVKSLHESEAAIPVLVDSGYCYWPYKNDVMHWLCKPSDVFRTHHLHLVPFESELWDERIEFRNKLQKDSHIAKQYGLLKRQLSIKYAYDREAYTQAKWPFIKNVLAKTDN